MDILLHISGLAFIPVMIYILFLGVLDITSVLRDALVVSKTSIS